MAGPKTIGMRKITKVVANPGTPEPISATPLYVTDFELYVPTTNTGLQVYIGDSLVDNTWIPRVKGGLYNFTHGDGAFLGPLMKLGFDLSKIYIAVASADDAVIVQYFAGDPS